MGNIRGRHTSPGVYTRITSIRKPHKGVVTAPMSTKNVVIGGNGAIPVQTNKIYYGYYPMVYINGQPSHDELVKLWSIQIGELLDKGNIQESEIVSKNVILNEVRIPEEVSEGDVLRYFNNGGSLEKLPNYCQILAVQSKYWDKMEIVDGTFNVSIKKLFTLLQKELRIDGINYTLIAIFDGHFVFAPLGMNAVISPIKLNFNN